MDWIFDNIQLIIIVGSSIAWWLTQQRQQKGEDEPPKPTDRPGRQRIDWEQKHAEQGGETDAARQVRERMRRLREQRGQPAAPRPTPSSSTPAPSVPRRAEVPGEDLPPVLRELFGIPESRHETPPPTPPPVPHENRAEQMSAEIRELEAKQREAEAMAARVRGKIGAPRRRRRRSTAAGADTLGDRDFLATLRDPASARRAILLKEILDRPVGLR